MSTLTASKIVNGINTELLQDAIDAVSQDSAKAQTRWGVTSYWRGGMRSDTRVTEYRMAGQRIAKDFTLHVDEPLELCGTNKYANPQEYLLTALNACMIVGYAAVCAHQGIELEALQIETEGDIDLRGFMGLDATVKPGYDHLRYTVRIKGNATPEQFEQIHRRVMETSPNYFNLATAVQMKPRLVVM